MFTFPRPLLGVLCAIAIALAGVLQPALTRRSTDVRSPPDGLPAYRVLTGVDDASFCRRVSDALASGYRLHGSPAITCAGRNVVVAQALVWPDAAEPAAAAPKNHETPGAKR
jgi:hypothetical protein